VKGGKNFNDIEISKKMRNIKPKLKIIFKPLLYSEMFFIFTVFLYLTGPVEYNKVNLPFLLFLLFIYQLMFILGYIFFVKRHAITVINDNPLSSSLNKTKHKERKVFHLLKFLIVTTLIFQMIIFYIYTQIAPIDFNEIISSVLFSINDPISSYTQSFSNSSYSGILILFLVLYSPFLYFTFALGIYYLGKLSLFYKLTLLMAIVYEVMRWVVLGRNKGVFDMLIIVFSVIIIKILQNRFINPREKRRKEFIKQSLNIVLVIILSVLVLSYFTNTIGSRTQHYSYSPEYYNSLLLKITPNFLHSFLIYLTNYLTQGYRALSHIADVTWTPMFGIGNSTFLIANFGSVFKTDLFQYTYQFKLTEYGIDSTASWHTFYTWVANDVHWLGVTIVMFFIGYFFAFVSVRAIVYRDTIAYPLFALLFMIIFYMSGNNQVFSYPYSFMAFWLLIIYWLLIKLKVIKYSSLVNKEPTLINN